MVLVGGDEPVHERPLLVLPRRDLLAHEDDLAGAAVADHDRQPLGRPAGRNRPVLRPDVADECVVDHHRQVARHLQLVAAADRDPVDAGEGRLVEVVLGPRAEVGADAECPAGPREDDDAELVVPGSVLARARELPEHLEVERVQDLGPVERDRRARWGFLVDDLLEAELVRRDRARAGGLAHWRSAKWTWNGTPISIASLPVAMNSSVRAALLKASMSANSQDR